MNEETLQTTEYYADGGLDYAAYPQLVGNGRRRDHGSEIQAQAVSLDMHKRRRAVVLARDLYKESKVLRWAVDFHCLNTTSFGFRPMSDDQGFNRALLDFYDYFNETADLTGRFQFEELWDVWEHRRVLDGDVLVILLDDGRLQTIQSNWLADDPACPDCVQGLYLDAYGRTTGYHVERQTTRGQIKRYRIPAEHTEFIAYYDYEVDAYRGVTPLMSALAGFQDLDEILVDMYSKIKLESRLGLAIKSRRNELGFQNPSPAAGTPTSGGGEVVGKVDGEGNLHSQDRQRQRLKMDEMINVLRLGANDELSSFMQTSPSTTFQQFFLMAVQADLKPLGIPLTMYQENLSNYYCSRAAYGLYQNFIKDIVYGNQQRYARLFRWRLAVADRKGEFRLPRGMLASHVPFAFMPEIHSVLDEDREARGSQLQIQMGFSTPQQEAAKRGKSYFDNIRETSRAMAFAKEQGVPISCLAAQSDRSQEILNRYNSIAIAVRGGFLTPSPEIEALVRDELHLPPMTPEVSKAWEATGSIRQPITLKPAESAAIADELEIENEEPDHDTTI